MVTALLRPSLLPLKLAANTSGDAGAQLRAAAQAMATQGSGKAAKFYANGLQAAAQQFAGQSNISADNLVPFLQSFVSGVQQNNPARPGQGTMIDALNPALNALTSAQGSGEDTIGAMSSALGAAITGTQRTAGTAGRVDPGAASATNVLGGIFSPWPPVSSISFSAGLPAVVRKASRATLPTPAALRAVSAPSLAASLEVVLPVPAPIRARAIQVEASVAC